MSQCSLGKFLKNIGQPRRNNNTFNNQHKYLNSFLLNIENNYLIELNYFMNNKSCQSNDMSFNLSLVDSNKTEEIAFDFIKDNKDTTDLHKWNNISLCVKADTNEYNVI